jgi:hypothetical protein
MAYMIEVTFVSRADGLHLNCVGLEKGRVLRVHILDDKKSHGNVAFIGTTNGTRMLSKEEKIADAVKKEGA